MTPRLLAEKMAVVLNAKMAQDIVVLEVSELTVITDYFVICTGNSSTQLKAMSEEVERVLELEGQRPHHIEGFAAGGWVLLDYGDVIAHLFLKDTREFYSLERLWNDAKTIDVSGLLTPGR